jgi:hypothetical protein
VDWRAVFAALKRLLRLGPGRALWVFDCDEFLCVLAGELDHTFGLDLDRFEVTLQIQFTRCWVEFENPWVQRFGPFHRFSRRCSFEL